METTTVRNEIRKVYISRWKDCNLSESLFENKVLQIDSDDIRCSDNIKDLKLVVGYLKHHIKNLNEMTNFFSSDKRIKKHKGYIFTQSCLLQQTEWAICKLRKEYKLTIK